MKSVSGSSEGDIFREGRLANKELMVSINI